MDDEQKTEESSEDDSSLTKEDVSAILPPKNETNLQEPTPQPTDKPVSNLQEPKKPEEPAVTKPSVESTQPLSLKEWLSRVGWKTNPFIFNINPSLIVGYEQQKARITMSLEEKHKFLLILGPTGSGKTTLLKWLESKINKKEGDVLYIGKPPQKPEEFVLIFNEKYRKPWYAFWKNRLETIYQIPLFLNRRINRHLVVLMDEAHEAPVDVLEWLRVLNDQVEKMSVVISGLPVFEDNLRNNLETFAKRITAKIELLSLTKEETGELITKRVKSVGGTGNEFSPGVIESIYMYTGGFPREIIRLCDELVNNAILSGRTQIEFTPGKREDRRAEARPVTATILDKMTPMQKEILEMLSKRPMTPGQVANAIDLTKYKSRQHAVRSVNNVVKALQEDGYLERRKEDKAYVYSLAARISTLFVKR